MSQVEERPVLDAVDAVELVFHANNCEIPGRTALQKLVYFASRRVPGSKVDYAPHYFGPFSAKVAEILAELCFAGRAYEVRIPWGDHAGFEYHLTGLGKELVDIALVEQPASTIETIKDTVKTCKEACDLRASDLSYAAKVHYAITQYAMRNLPEPKNVTDVHNIAYGFRWDVTEDNIRAGYALLRKLDLAPIQL
ncbi:MAG: hypothetical protein OXU86_06680 [Thaumarchaeota archaeon]|nr:hypothetical protein [Nitrososphaerota archaeon]RNJ73311.1 MAG: hypothetical protein EB824_04945 [Thaumarchaeota archaeon S15]